MKLQSSHVLLPLDARSPQRLTRAKGLLLRARRGTVWITVDGDPRDIVLAPGEQWVVDSSEPVIVSALHKSALIEACDAALRRTRAQRKFWAETMEWLRDRGARMATVQGCAA